VAVAFALGTLTLALALGPGKALVGLILLSLGGLLLARLAIRQIGGQTGDILGAFEQTGEILILLVAAAFQMGR
jgi:adenosylcobinamide-GDP ribazoletransferase